MPCPSAPPWNPAVVGLDAVDLDGTGDDGLARLLPGLALMPLTTAVDAATGIGVRILDLWGGVLHHLLANGGREPTSARLVSPIRPA